ncbi:MAG: hypothetical protein M1546_00365 [Chloroflexi bacterium]|nr:hypothetical protein [Chloroflexota bacterium]
MATDNPNMVANSNPSQKNAKPRTSKTSRVKVDDIVTLVDVAEFFRSSVAYAQRAGSRVVAEVQGDMLVLGIPGLTLADGQIVANVATNIATNIGGKVGGKTDVATNIDTAEAS